MDSLGLVVAAGAGIGLWYYLTRRPAAGGSSGGGGAAGGGRSGGGGQAPPSDRDFVARWTDRIASDVANTYHANIDAIERSEDAGGFVRVYFTARSASGEVGRYVASLTKGADPSRLAEGTNRGEYGYRYYYGTSITRLS